ncbi:MAG TPA: hypothetical protein VFS43_14235 [Polyangiaceae bacterium]|nr:hypothetical protein [Polyangiaceae bacterium]
MATKAEQERSRQERSGPDQPKKYPEKRRQASIRKENVKRQTSGRPADGVTASRNIVDDTDNHKRTYQLEDSGNGKPSRKSTRAGANRIKPDSQLRRQETRQNRSPQARAAAGAVGRNT